MPQAGAGPDPLLASSSRGQVGATHAVAGADGLVTRLWPSIRLSGNSPRGCGSGSRVQVGAGAGAGSWAQAEAGAGAGGRQSISTQFRQPSPLLDQTRPGEGESQGHKHAFGWGSPVGPTPMRTSHTGAGPTSMRTSHTGAGPTPMRTSHTGAGPTPAVFEQPRPVKLRTSADGFRASLPTLLVAHPPHSPGVSPRPRNIHPCQPLLSPTQAHRLSFNGLPPTLTQLMPHSFPSVPHSPNMPHSPSRVQHRAPPSQTCLSPIQVQRGGLPPPAHSPGAQQAGRTLRSPAPGLPPQLSALLEPEDGGVLSPEIQQGRLSYLIDNDVSVGRRPKVGGGG